MAAASKTNRQKCKELSAVGRVISHPGQILKNQYLKKMQLSISEVARALGLKRETLRDFCVGRTAMTSDLAIRLSIYFSTSDEFWANLQYSFDRKHALFVLRLNKYNIKPLQHCKPILATTTKKG